MKIRSSALGKIMTNSRTKGTLSKTCKSYIEELFLEQELGIKKDFWSRYTDKGMIVEKDGITLANEVLEWGLPFSEIHGDQHSLENDYITGHTDVLNKNLLADIKCSWNASTFPFFEDAVDKNYMWQLMGYMFLTGYDKAELVYCLINTPEHMVLDEIKREHWKQNSYWNGDEDPDIEAHIRSQHNFDNMDKNMRVKRYIIERDEKLIEAIKERVEECREYYKTLKSKINK